MLEGGSLRRTIKNLPQVFQGVLPEKKWFFFLNHAIMAFIYADLLIFQGQNLPQVFGGTGKADMHEDMTYLPGE